MDDSDEARVRRAVRNGIRDARPRGGCSCCLVFVVVFAYYFWALTHR